MPLFQLGSDQDFLKVFSGKVLLVQAACNLGTLEDGIGPGLFILGLGQIYEMREGFFLHPGLNIVVGKDAFSLGLEGRASIRQDSLESSNGFIPLAQFLKAESPVVEGTVSIIRIVGLSCSDFKQSCRLCMIFGLVMLNGQLVSGSTDQGTLPMDRDDLGQTVPVGLRISCFLIADSLVVTGLDCVGVGGKPRVKAVKLPGSCEVA